MKFFNDIDWKKSSNLLLFGVIPQWLFLIGGLLWKSQSKSVLIFGVVMFFLYLFLLLYLGKRTPRDKSEMTEEEKEALNKREKNLRREQVAFIVLLAVVALEPQIEAIPWRIRWERSPEYQTRQGDISYEKKQYMDAFRWYSKAAAQGYPDAQNSLGYMYLHGEPIEQNYDSARKYFVLAADSGNSNAINNLGFMSLNGFGEEQDFVRARVLFLQAADSNNVVSQLNLGIMYEDSLGVAANLDSAIMWYEKAANQGYVYAQHKLGKIYKYTLKDKEKANEWFRKAADQKYEPSMMEILHSHDSTICGLKIEVSDSIEEKYDSIEEETEYTVIFGVSVR